MGLSVTVFTTNLFAGYVQKLFVSNMLGWSASSDGFGWGGSYELVRVPFARLFAARPGCHLGPSRLFRSSPECRIAQEFQIAFVSFSAWFLSLVGSLFGPASTRRRQ